ncbi:MAG: hypothetical protein JSS99_07770 [Actinobacteria bacterium]|nr:hypothetical protein [Actinomycetota bacterium]
MRRTPRRFGRTSGRVAAVALVAALAAGPPALARRHAPYEKYGIAGVHLNDTMRQVVKHLGKPLTLRRLCSRTACNDPRYCRSAGGWRATYPAQLTVVYAIRSLKDYCKPGKSHVDSVTTRSPKDYLPNGVHVGSTVGQLKRAFHKLYCSHGQCDLVKCYCGVNSYLSGYDYDASFRLHRKRIYEIELALGYGS